MLSSIFLKTIWDYRKSIISWGIGLFFFISLYSAFYPSLQGSDILEAYDELPDAFVALVGDVGSFSTPEGYVTVEFLSLTYPLLAGILAITLGSGLLYKEEESGTLELLLASPISRRRIVTEKALSMMIILAIVTLFGWLALAGSTLLIDSLTLNIFNTFMAFVAGFFAVLVLGMLALFITSATGKRGFAIGLCIVVFLVSHLILTFSGLVEWLEPFSRLSIFYYYDAANLLTEGWNFMYFLVLASASTLLFILALKTFNKRDTGL